MIKYLNYSITFQEVPDETSLCFNITNCKYRCKGCHSPELREDIGEDLEPKVLDIIGRYRDGITCVCLLGEGNDFDALWRVLKKIRAVYPGLKTCIYSGSNNGEEFIEFVSAGLIDYLKLGPYNEDKGGLSSVTTNQRMFSFRNRRTTDITEKFWRKKV